MQIARKNLRIIKAPLPNRVPGALSQDLGINLTFPKDLCDLAIGVVIEACQPNDRVAAISWGLDVFYEVVVAAAEHHTPLGWLGEDGLRHE